MEELLKRSVANQNQRVRGSLLTIEDAHNALKYFENKCCYCRMRPFECLDHIKAVSSGGKSIKYNIVPSCRKCNNKKMTKDLLSFFVSNPDLDVNNMIQIHNYIWSLD